MSGGLPQMPVLSKLRCLNCICIPLAIIHAGCAATSFLRLKVLKYIYLSSLPHRIPAFLDCFLLLLQCSLRHLDRLSPHTDCSSRLYHGKVTLTSLDSFYQSTTDSCLSSRILFCHDYHAAFPSVGSAHLTSTHSRYTCRQRQPHAVTYHGK